MPAFPPLEDDQAGRLIRVLRAIAYLGFFAAGGFLVVFYSVQFRPEQYKLVHIHQLILYVVIGLCTVTLALMRRGHIRAGGALQLASLWLSLTIVPDLMGVPLHVISANHIALAICMGPLTGWMGALTLGVGSLVYNLIQDSGIALGLGITPLLEISPIQILVIEMALYGMVLSITVLIVFLSQRRSEISQVTAEALEVASYSEKKLETIIESMADVLLVVDVKGIINKANRAAFKLLGYTEGELLGQPLRLLMLDIAEDATGVESMSRKQALNHVSKRLKTKDGGVLPVSMSSAIMTDSLGQPAGLILVAKDMTEIENMRLKLHMSNARFNQAVVFSRIGVFEYDLEHGEFILEESLRQNLSAAGLELVADFKEFMELVVPEDRDLVTKALADYRAGDNPRFDVEFRVNAAQGIRWIMVRGALQAGGGTRLIGTFMDVTRRKRAELELALRDNVLRAITESSEIFLRTSDWESQIPAMMAALGAAARVSRVYIFVTETGKDGRGVWSQKYEWTAPGISPEIDNPDLQNFDYMNRGFKEWAEKMSAGQPVCGIVSEMPAEVRAIYEKQGIKSVANMPVFVQDKWWGLIGFDDCWSERKWSDPELDALQLAADSLGAAIYRQRVERDLKENRDFLMTIMDNLGQGVTVIDGSGKLLFVNAAAAALVGVPAEKLIGHQPVEFIDPELVDDMMGQRAIRREGKSTSYPTRVHHVDGSVTDVIVSGVPRYVDGKVEGAYSVLTNVSEQRKMEENQMQLGIEREQMRIMSDFVRDASHDFRTPLSIIQTSLYLLRRKIDAPEHQDRLETIGLQASRLSRLIDGLLSMLEMDKADISLIPINLKTVAQNAIERARDVAHKAGLSLDLSAPEDPVFVNGEEGYLMKAVSNLVDNAIAFTAAGGRIKLEIAATDAQAELSVSDTGIGIAPEEHQRIFERLYKVDKARTIDSGGLGMGLSITKRIMEMHGGSISVKSAPGEGSTFTLTFGRAKQSPPRHRQATSSSPITEDVKM